jgi:hypothetical protein
MTTGQRTATVHFSSSESFMEFDPQAAESANVTLPGDYIEATYESLRHGPDGTEFAWLLNGAWELADGRRFSDWAVRVQS